MTDQDGIGTGKSGTEGQCEVSPPRQALRADEPGDDEEIQEQQRNADVQQVAVVVVLRHQRHHFLGRVVRVLAEDEIEHRYRDEGVDQREPGRQRIAAGCEVQCDGDARDDGRGQRSQPQITLAVDVRDDGAIGCLSDESHDSPPMTGQPQCTTGPRASPTVEGGETQVPQRSELINPCRMNKSHAPDQMRK